MPSSKGKPTDPKLREQIKEKVKNQPNKDGGGKGSWSAWKAAELSKEYEKQGGGYENESGSKNEPKKGTPEPKSDSKKKTEASKSEQNGDKKDDKKDDKNDDKKDEKKEDKKEDKKEANSAKKMAPAKKSENKPKSAASKKKSEPIEGFRRSARVQKRSADEDAEGDKKKQRKK